MVSQLCELDGEGLKLREVSSYLGVEVGEKNWCSLSLLEVFPPLFFCLLKTGILEYPNDS